MDYSVRTGPVSELTDTLRQFAADRGDRGESERAGDAERAADALEGGADAAYFDRVIYGEGDPDRYSVRRLPRVELEAELREHVEGWQHQGKPALAAEARTALGELAQGAETVRVGHLVYEICG
jgi:hypothetical protein